MKRVVIVATTLLIIGCGAVQNNRSWDLDTQWGFTEGIEGAAHDALGNLYAVNYGKTDGTIGIIKAGSNQAELFLDLPNGSIGNGIVFDNEGVMYIADYTGHNIWQYDGDLLSILAHDSVMNQPNDMTITPNNQFIFASDPKWVDSTGQLWRVEIESGELVLMESGMGTTNGLEVSPDGRALYLNESRQLNVWRYDLDEQGNLSNKQIFVRFEGYGMDGMRCDAQGNLYITRFGKGSVVKVSPKGEIVREWELTGQEPCNITLVGDRAYVTMADRGCFEVIDLN